MQPACSLHAACLEAEACAELGLSPLGVTGPQDSRTGTWEIQFADLLPGAPEMRTGPVYAARCASGTVLAPGQGFVRIS